MTNNKDKSFQQCVSLQFNKNSISILRTTKDKYYKKAQSSDLKTCLFSQAIKDNIENILKIKDAFPKLFPSKIIEIYNIANNNRKKSKLKLNITTKGPPRKQVIIPMSKNNSNIITS